MDFVFTSKVSQFLVPKRPNLRRNPEVDDEVEGYLYKVKPLIVHWTRQAESKNTDRTGRCHSRATLIHFGRS